MRTTSRDNGRIETQNNTKKLKLLFSYNKTIRTNNKSDNIIRIALFDVIPISYYFTCPFSVPKKSGGQAEELWIDRKFGSIPLRLK